MIREVETRLPVPLFANEWDYLKKDPVKSWRGRYVELGIAERLVPAAFVALYLAASIWVCVV